MKFKTLSQLRENYPTQSGLAYLSQGSIFKNKDLHKDLATKSWFELNLYGITNREFTKKQLKILNYIWLSTSYADIRIWPNRISALAASARSTPILALTAGLASCDAKLFVAQPLVECLSMLKDTYKKIKKGNSLESIIEKKLQEKSTIFGYGRPLVSIDERVPYFVEFLHKNDMDNGQHFKLAFKIEALLKEKKKVQMNIAALYSAICADFGFNNMEMNLFVSLLVFSGMPPCYLDTLEKPEGAFIPLSCDDIHYIGKKEKIW